MATTVAVDFDKVIHTYDRGWQDGTIYGELMPGAVVGLTRLMQQHAVFILTSRKPRPVADWIERQSGYGIECTTRVPRKGFWDRRGYLLVTNRKLPAVAYIDDRGIRFESWDQALADLARYTTAPIEVVPGDTYMRTIPPRLPGPRGSPCQNRRPECQRP
jgi:hypothetical protein